MSDESRVAAQAKLGVDGRSQTVRIRVGERYDLVLLRPRTRILQLEDVCFGTTRSVVLPALPRPAGSGSGDLRGQRDGLAVIAATLAFSRLHPTRSLLVAGHTDSVGSASANLELAHKRASNVLLLLQGDKGAWAADCNRNFMRADFKHVHLWATHARGWNTNPGPLDDAWNAHTKAAREEFRRKCEEELGVTLKHDVAQNEGDWAAIFDLYEMHLASMLRIGVGELPQLRNNLSFAGTPSIGCGEHWPIDAFGIDEYASADNRRVDILFFDRGELPDDVVGEPPGVAVYGAKRFKPEYLPVRALGDPAGVADFELLLAECVNESETLSVVF